MINTIDLEFIQALNPLYAVPIVAVIICAFLVYAIGFKSPVQPPSFDGFEEEKKLTKKRKTKETAKSKIVQNGKLNGSGVVKNQSPSNKKKEVKESPKIISEKPEVEKPAVVDKKQAAKKTRVTNEKKSPVDKKKDVVPHEDNDGDWVQLVSKKGRKGRKKEDVAHSDTLVNNVEVHKADEPVKLEDSPKKISEAVEISPVVEEKQVSSKSKKAASKKEKEVVSTVEKNQEQVLNAKIAEPEVNDLKKVSTKENVVKEEKLIEESSSKSKKKKKKATEVVKEQIITDVKISEKPLVKEQNVTNVKISEKPLVQTAEIPTSHDNSTSASAETDNKPSDVKVSNVAFDELAGLYPEAKEPKKKKKVRRDH